MSRTLTTRTLKTSALTAAVLFVVIVGPMGRPASAATDDQLVVITDDGQPTTVTVHDGTLTVVTGTGDDATVHEVDLTGLGELVGEAVTQALAGLDGAFAGLADMDVDIHVRPEHQLVLDIDGGTTVIDLGEVMAQVDDALAAVRSEVACIGEQQREHDGAASLHRESRRLRRQIAELEEQIQETKEELAAQDRR